MTEIELDCLDRLAAAMKRHLGSYKSGFPPPDDPIWQVFRACSHIDAILYRHLGAATASSGRSACGVERAAIC